LPEENQLLASGASFVWAAIRFSPVSSSRTSRSTSGFFHR
jgi:hypothetical protein